MKGANFSLTLTVCACKVIVILNFTLPDTHSGVLTCKQRRIIHLTMELGYLKLLGA